MEKFIDDEYKQAFEYCKTLLYNEPILVYPDFSKHFLLTTDSLKFNQSAIGSVLSQNGHPISYMLLELSIPVNNFTLQL